jgi:hypothetical protein
LLPSRPAIGGRAAQKTGREHAHAADGAKRQCAAARETLGNDAQHRRPIEGLAQAVDGRGHDQESSARYIAQHQQPDGAQHGAAEQQAQRRNLMDDRPGEEAQGEHQARGPDEQQQTVGLVLQDGAGDVGDPAIGAQLDVADHGVQHEQECQHPMAQAEAGEVAEDQEQHGGDDPAQEGGQAQIGCALGQPQAQEQ